MPVGMTSNWVRVSLMIAPALLASVPARSASFGRINVTAVMGQPLQMLVALRSEDGERIGAECLSADILSGEQRLPANEIRVEVRAGASANEWLARVTTTSPIVEPVLEINLTAGCEHPYTRHYTAFADPPLAPSPATAMAVASLPEESLASIVAGRGAAPVAVPRAVAREARRSAALSPNRESSPRVPLRPAMAQARSAAHDSGRQAASRLQLEIGQGPILRMDVDDPVAIASAPGGGLGAGPSGSLAAGEAEAADQRLLALESRLRLLVRESQVAQARNADLQARLERSESLASGVPWLSGTLAVLVLAAAALFWRKRSQRSGESRTWSARGRASAGAIDDESQWGGSPGADTATGPSTEANLDRRDSGAATTGSDEPEAKLAASTTVAGAAAFGGGGITPAERYIASVPPAYDALAEPAREVSVEELLDLEQQADFFIALGQEDAAVDLLMAYLRSTGGLSPLPYTQLLEIYRRQGDRSAYERIRARFNRRFNAYAPDWDTGPQTGRWLEDYPDAVDHLESVWSSPLDAMAVLEAMLFRRDESQDLFDLPAYKDVLLLYAIARDNWQSGHAGEAHEVDLLLPLGEGGRQGAGLDRTQPIDVDLGFPIHFELNPVEDSNTVSPSSPIPPNMR